MTIQVIHTSSVQVQNGALAIDAYLALPEGEGPFPAVIVVQEIFGVNAHIRDITERFARLGYVAIAPAIYQRLAPGFETGYGEEDIKQGRVYKEQTKVEELLGDVRAAAHYLSELPIVKEGAIGCIGFCFGGVVAYLAATLPEVKAAASFYGAGIPVWAPGGGAPVLTYTPQITGTLYAFFGMDDPSIPPEHIDQIEAALKKNQTSYSIFRYPGAQHGFFCNERGSYNSAAAADAWERVQELFSKSL